MPWCSSRQGMMKNRHDELERSGQDLTKCQGHMLTQLDHAPYQSMRRTMGPEPELARHSRFRWPQPIWVKHTLHGSELFRDHESVAVFFFIMHGVRATWAATRSFVTCIEDDHSSRETYQPIQNKKRCIMHGIMPSFRAQTCRLDNGHHCGRIKHVLKEKTTPHFKFCKLPYNRKWTFLLAMFCNGGIVSPNRCHYSCIAIAFHD